MRIKIADVQHVKARRLHALFQSFHILEHSICREFRPIMEAHAAAQMKAPSAPPVEHLPASCKARSGSARLFIVCHERFPDLENLAAIVAVMLARSQVSVRRQNDGIIFTRRLRCRRIRLGTACQKQRSKQQKHQEPCAIFPPPHAFLPISKAEASQLPPPFMTLSLETKNLRSSTAPRCGASTCKDCRRAQSSNTTCRKDCSR